MANTIHISGVTELSAKLNKRKLEAVMASRAEVRVGYTANYALWVHEMKGMKLKGQPRPKPKKGKYWDPQGRAQPKFLETPTRNLINSGELKTLISTAYKGGAKLEQALYIAGLRIQRESQLMVPVDTGNLKGSAFTRKGKK